MHRWSMYTNKTMLLITDEKAMMGCAMLHCCCQCDLLSSATHSNADERYSSSLALGCSSKSSPLTPIPVWSQFSLVAKSADTRLPVLRRCFALRKTVLSFPKSYRSIRSSGPSQLSRAETYRRIHDDNCGQFLCVYANKLEISARVLTHTTA